VKSRLTKRWNSIDIDFFVSNFEEKSIFIEKAITHAEKKYLL
jgi:hypothetical protein